MQSRTHSGVRPPALGARSKVGVVSLASSADPADLIAGCGVLNQLTGWEVEAASTQPQGDFAGSSEDRVAALYRLWQREDLGAVLCARGGYGSNYLLPLLDPEALKAAPKAFVGYSDNTSILLALDRLGLVSFHGPMVASDFACGRADAVSFRAALAGEPLDFSFAAGCGIHSLVEGDADGPLTGGCLSVLVTSLGTPWEVQTEGKLLFLEDVSEKPFRVDRMLMHLLLAGKFEGVRGIIFGAMRGCLPNHGEETLPQLILRILGNLGVPIVFGVPSGHVQSGNLTLPFGVPSQLQSSASGVRLQVEPATLVAS